MGAMVYELSKTKKDKGRTDRTDRGIGQSLWIADVGTWELNRLPGARAMTETMWKCDAMRAGQLYNRMMFDTKQEAEEFMARMSQMEPDQFFKVEPVDASQIWN
jgi:hypothetical protein